MKPRAIAADHLVITGAPENWDVDVPTFWRHSILPSIACVIPARRRLAANLALAMITEASPFPARWVRINPSSHADALGISPALLGRGVSELVAAGVIQTKPPARGPSVLVLVNFRWPFLPRSNPAGRNRQGTTEKSPDTPEAPTGGTPGAEIAPPPPSGRTTRPRFT